MASGKKISFDSELASHIFLNASISGIGDSLGLRGSSVNGSLYLALFSSSPTDSAVGTEMSYSNYARVSVPRTGSFWAVSGIDVTNRERIIFPACGGASGIAVAFAICKGQAVGVDDAIFYNILERQVQITPQSSPVFAIGQFSI